MGVPEWVSSNFVDRHEEVVNSGVAANQRHQNVDVRNGRDSADSSMGYFEVLSGNFDAGQICLGGNGGDHDALEQDAFDGHCSNYVVFVGPQELEPFFPGSAGASARYFDGDSDYVALPRLDGGSKRPKRAFDILTIDTWVKFFDTTGNHPIMNEDGWDTGDLHCESTPYGVSAPAHSDRTDRLRDRPNLRRDLPFRRQWRDHRDADPRRDRGRAFPLAAHRQCLDLFVCHLQYRE